MDKFSIGDIEVLTGVKAHTIRIWEKRYNVVEPKRTDTGIRFYSAADLCKLLNIADLNAKGHKISKLSKLNTRDLNALIENSVSDNLSQKFIQLKMAMLSYNAISISTLLHLWVAQEGLEACARNTIFPFLSKLGTLWRCSSICAAHEHMVSNAVRQLFFKELDNSILENKVKSTSNHLFFLPEDEMHELALLYKCVEHAKLGENVIYLGPNLPETTLNNVLENASLSKISTHLTLPMSETKQANLFTLLNSIIDTYNVDVYLFLSDSYEIHYALGKIKKASFS